MNKLILLLLIFCTACRYERTEEDKHPELPVFPLHTNDHFTITKLPYYNYTFVDLFNRYLYTTCEMEENGSSVETKYLVIYDRNFKQVCKAKVDNYILLDKTGNVYVLNSGSVEKYLYPVFKRKTIEKFPYNSQLIYDENKEYIAGKRKEDSTYCEYDFLGAELSRYIREYKHGTFTCCVDLGHTLLLKFGKKDYFLTDPHLSAELLENCKNPILNSDSASKEHLKMLQPKLFDFDHAVLGNKMSMGRSYEYYFRQYGWDYFNLVIQGDTAKFKSQGRSLYGSLTEYPGFNEKQVLLQTGISNSLYVVQRKKK